MSKSGMTIDSTEFQKKFLTVALRTVPNAVEKGMFRGISKLKQDSDNIEPRTPHLTGLLRGSGEIFVKSNISSVTGELIYSAPYAAKLHEAEGLVNWSEEGVGPKYVENKMARFSKKYHAIVNEYIREVLG